MKVLIIGGGAIAEMFHIPAAIKLLGIENVFIVESNQKQSAKLKLEFNLININESIELYIQSVDFCILATPPHTHLNLIKICLEHFKPVLCEKPIALNINECSEILQLQKKSKVLVALCHSYRFFPNRNYLRNLIQEGYFGENLCIKIEEGEPASWQSISGYNFRKELVPGGVLLDAGIHSLDFILWCIGKPVSIAYTDDSLGGLESNCDMFLEFENQSTAHFQLSRTNNLSNKIIVKGSLNQCEIPIFEMLTLIENEKEREIKSEKLVDWSTLAVLQLENFMFSIKNPKEIKCDLQSGIDVSELIEKCYLMKKSRALPIKAILPGELF